MDKTEIEVPGYIRSGLSSSRRPAEDRERDEVRQLADVFAAFGIKPGDKVLDMMASRGYITSALANIVGEDGTVYAHNSEKLLARFKGDDPIQQRIEACGLTNVTPIISELEDIALPEPADAALSIMFYHDSVWIETDRAAMNTAVFDALKPGGLYGIIDHHAQAGSGTSACQTLHRIEREVVVDEVQAAGFDLADECNLLDNPDDPLTAMCHDKSIRNNTSKFMLLFRKPT